LTAALPFTHSNIRINKEEQQIYPKRMLGLVISPRYLWLIYLMTCLVSVICLVEISNIYIYTYIYIYAHTPCPEWIIMTSRCDITGMMVWIGGIIPGPQVSSWWYIVVQPVNIMDMFGWYHMDNIFKIYPCEFGIGQNRG
jgi:hypothetical protein